MNDHDTQPHEERVDPQDQPMVFDEGGPESAVSESLRAALTSLRQEADALEGMPLDERKVAAAEKVADAAAELDEQIGSVARSDDD